MRIVIAGRDNAGLSDVQNSDKIYGKNVFIFYFMKGNMLWHVSVILSCCIMYHYFIGSAHFPEVKSPFLVFSCGTLNLFREWEYQGLTSLQTCIPAKALLADKSMWK